MAPVPADADRAVHGGGPSGGGPEAASHGQGHATSEAAKDPETRGLAKAIAVLETTPAAQAAKDAVQAARINSPELPVEVEVENIEELEQALSANVERVLLDNFSIDMLTQAVKINNKQTELEASGGITLDNVRNIAETGVDYISTGAITKDIKSLDLSMRFS